MSYHIDVDIASSMTPTQHYEGPYDKPASPYDASVPNPEFELSSMRTNADHETPWCSNSTYWTLFWPKAGLECSVQKTKDWVYGGKPERVGRFFKAVPSGMDTIHCDAWHDDAYSWEPEDVEGHGYIGEYENQPCGSSKDIQLFAARGISFGSEGPNGCTGNYLGADGKSYDRSDPIVGTGQSYWWHGAQYSQQYFGKIISGSEMGQDCDIAPWIGARCSTAPTATSVGTFPPPISSTPAPPAIRSSSPSAALTALYASASSIPSAVSAPPRRMAKSCASISRPSYSEPPRHRW